MRLIGRLVPRKQWQDMAPAEKIGNVLMAVVEVALVTWALVDLSHRPAEAINGKKRTWVLASLIQPFGPVIYLLFGRKTMPVASD
jgi:phospholipase D-like protein